MINIGIGVGMKRLSMEHDLYHDMYPKDDFPYLAYFLATGDRNTRSKLRYDIFVLNPHRSLNTP